VVHGEVFPGEATGPGGHPADPELATERLDWMRANRSRELGAGALDTIPKNRPYQMDHYQINDTWQSLSVVLDGAEIGGLYVPRQADQANPYGSPAELGAKLHDLAELEMALALEYLYARFSLQSPDAGKARSATLGADLIFARHQLMLAATSEMQHLRWVNEMLWGLQEAKLIPTFTPVLTVAREIPLRPGKAPRAAELRRLEPAVLQDFIDVEHPSGTLNGAYARVVATLRGRQYPARLRELAARIVSDGVEHESLFLNVQRLLVTYGPTEPFPYLRALAVDRSGRADGALATFQEIVEALDKAYRAAAAKRLERTGHEVAKARMAMARLLEQGEDLAAAGVGIPFF
jgi:hypothetical protein